MAKNRNEKNTTKFKSSETSTRSIRREERRKPEEPEKVSGTVDLDDDDDDEEENWWKRHPKATGALILLGTVVSVVGTGSVISHNRKKRSGGKGNSGYIEDKGGEEED